MKLDKGTPYETLWEKQAADVHAKAADEAPPRSAVQQALVDLLTTWDAASGLVLADWCEERALTGMAKLLRESLSIDSPWRVVRQLENLAFMLGVDEHAPVVANPPEWMVQVARSRVEAMGFGSHAFEAHRPGEMTILRTHMIMRTRILRVVVDPKAAPVLMVHQVVLNGKQTLIHNDRIPATSLNLLSRLGIGFPDMHPGEVIEFHIENTSIDACEASVSGLVRNFW